MKLLEYLMKQALLKDILTHYKHKFDDDFLTMACTDFGGYVEDNKCWRHVPNKAEIDWIARPFLKTFVNSHGVILQLSTWIASLNYEDAMEGYCKLCLSD